MNAIYLLATNILFAPAAEAKPDDSHLQCGLHCLFVCMVVLEVEAKLDEVEGKLGPPQAGGYSLADLKRVAEGYGLKTAAVRTSVENLARRNERFACIAHVRGHHFVMITDVDLGDAIAWRTPADCDSPHADQQTSRRGFVGSRNFAHFFRFSVLIIDKLVVGGNISIDGGGSVQIRNPPAGRGQTLFRTGVVRC